MQTQTAYIRGLCVDYNDRHAISRYIAVVLHPDVEHLRRRARSSDPETSWAGTQACFVPATMRDTYVGKGKWVDATTAFAGTLRLHRDRLDADVLTHEATHAALHIWRMALWSKGGRCTSVSLGPECGKDEENFCYLLGHLTDNLMNVVPLMAQAQASS